MRLIRVLTRFSRKNMVTLNTGNHAEAVLQYKKTKDEVRIKSSIAFWAGFFLSQLVVRLGLATFR